MTGRPDAPAVAALLAERTPELARDLLGEPNRALSRRDEWRFGRNGSLSVMTGGPKRGAWHDHEAGTGGDALGLVAHARREPMGVAYGWALAWLGIAGGGEPRPAPRPAPAPPESPREVPPPATLDLARRIWREAIPGDALRSLLPRYLEARGLRWEPGIAGVIRFHPRAWRNAAFGPAGPAMVALMTDPETEEPCGTHVTYLRSDGGGKAEGERAKIMLGVAGCIRLVPDAEVTLGLGVAEGIETALSMMQGFNWRPVWAATSAGGIARFPVLSGICSLTIFADCDGAGAKAARICAERWSAAGREARICSPPHNDFNDLMREALPDGQHRS
jgi:putative DNA primase/helicase